MDSLAMHTENSGCDIMVEQFSRPLVGGAVSAISTVPPHLLFGSCCVWLGGASVTSASRRAVICWRGTLASLSSSSLALHPFTGMGCFMTDKHGDYRAALKAISIMLTLWSALCWVLYH